MNPQSRTASPMRRALPIFLPCLLLLGALRTAPCEPVSTEGPNGKCEPSGDSLGTEISQRDSLCVHNGDTLAFVRPEEFTRGGIRRATLYGDLPLARTHIDPLRASIVGAVYTGVLVGLHMNMEKAWWRQGAGFHWKNDWDDVLQVDKAGHAISGYLMSYGLSEGMMGAGIARETAMVLGSGLGLLYQTYIELEDGYSENWGFSPSDMAANTFGVSLFLAQHYIPDLQIVTPKYQYVPAAWLDVPHLSSTWIDDYNSSTFWLSADVHSMLPAGLRTHWPAWLALSFGYGVRIGDAERSRRFIVALDYDLVQLLPDGGHVWNWFRQTLNYIKLPAPAVEFSSGRVRWYLAFPII
ncbi:MAG: DUF2279 domain-containing protein [Bacteroidetes bacterium]|nr:DUF2279 domain-containing protein [Bacteroidota bacterium]